MFLTVRATNTGMQAIRRAGTRSQHADRQGANVGRTMAAHTPEQRLLMTLLVVFVAAAGLLPPLAIRMFSVVRGAAHRAKHAIG
jgi:hypothetical protein